MTKQKKKILVTSFATIATATAIVSAVAPAAINDEHQQAKPTAADSDLSVQQINHTNHFINVQGTALASLLPVVALNSQHAEQTKHTALALIFKTISQQVNNLNEHAFSIQTLIPQPKLGEIVVHATYNNHPLQDFVLVGLNTMNELIQTFNTNILNSKLKVDGDNLTSTNALNNQVIKSKITDAVLTLFNNENFERTLLDFNNYLPLANGSVKVECTYANEPLAPIIIHGFTPLKNVVSAIDEVISQTKITLNSDLLQQTSTQALNDDLVSNSIMDQLTTACKKVANFNASDLKITNMVANNQLGVIQVSCTYANEPLTVFNVAGFITATDLKNHMTTNITASLNLKQYWSYFVAQAFNKQLSIQGLTKIQSSLKQLILTNQTNNWNSKLLSFASAHAIYSQGTVEIINAYYDGVKLNPIVINGFVSSTTLIDNAAKCFNDIVTPDATLTSSEVSTEQLDTYNELVAQASQNNNVWKVNFVNQPLKIIQRINRSSTIVATINYFGLRINLTFSGFNTATTAALVAQALNDRISSLLMVKANYTPELANTYQTTTNEKLQTALYNALGFNTQPVLTLKINHDHHVSYVKFTWPELQQDLSFEYQSVSFMQGAVFTGIKFTNNSHNQLITNNDTTMVGTKTVVGFISLEQLYSLLTTALNHQMNLNQRFYDGSQQALSFQGANNFMMDALKFMSFITHTPINEIPVSAIPNSMNNPTYWYPYWSKMHTFITNAYNTYVEQTLSKLFAWSEGSNSLKVNGTLYHFDLSSIGFDFINVNGQYGMVFNHNGLSQRSQFLPFTNYKPALNSTAIPSQTQLNMMWNCLSPYLKSTVNLNNDMNINFASITALQFANELNTLQRQYQGCVNNLAFFDPLNNENNMYVTAYYSWITAKFTSKTLLCNAPVSTGFIFNNQSLITYVPKNITAPLSANLWITVDKNYNQNGYVNGVNALTGSVVVNYYYGTYANNQTPKLVKSDVIINGFATANVSINTSNINATNQKVAGTNNYWLKDVQGTSAIDSANLADTEAIIKTLVEQNNVDNEMNPWIDWNDFKIESVSVANLGAGTLNVSATYQKQKLTFVVSGLKTAADVINNFNLTINAPDSISNYWSFFVSFAYTGNSHELFTLSNALYKTDYPNTQSITQLDNTKTLINTAFTTAQSTIADFDAKELSFNDAHALYAASENGDVIIQGITYEGVQLPDITVSGFISKTALITAATKAWSNIATSYHNLLANQVSANQLATLGDTLYANASPVLKQNLFLLPNNTLQIDNITPSNTATNEVNADVHYFGLQLPVTFSGFNSPTTNSAVAQAIANAINQYQLSITANYTTDQITRFKANVISQIKTQIDETLGYSGSNPNTSFSLNVTNADGTNSIVDFASWTDFNEDLNIEITNTDLNSGSITVAISFSNNSNNTLINGTDTCDVCSTTITGFATPKQIANVINDYFENTNNGAVNMDNKFYESSATTVLTWQQLQALNLPASGKDLKVLSDGCTLNSTAWMNDDTIWSVYWNKLHTATINGYNAYLNAYLPTIFKTDSTGLNTVNDNGTIYYFNLKDLAWTFGTQSMGANIAVAATINFTYLNQNSSNPYEIQLGNMISDNFQSSCYFGTQSSFSNVIANEQALINTIQPFLNTEVNWTTNSAVLNTAEQYSANEIATILSNPKNTSYSSILQNLQRLLMFNFLKNRVYYGSNSTTHHLNAIVNNAMLIADVVNVGGYEQGIIDLNSAAETNANSTQAIVPFASNLQVKIDTSVNSNGFLNGINPVSGAIAVTLSLVSGSNTTTLTSNSGQNYFVINGLKQESPTLLTNITLNAENENNAYATFNPDPSNTPAYQLSNEAPIQAINSTNLANTKQALKWLIQYRNRSNYYYPWIDWNDVKINQVSLVDNNNSNGELNVEVSYGTQTVTYLVNNLITAANCVKTFPTTIVSNNTTTNYWRYYIEQAFSNQAFIKAYPTATATVRNEIIQNITNAIADTAPYGFVASGLDFSKMTMTENNKEITCEGIISIANLTFSNITYYGALVPAITLTNLASTANIQSAYEPAGSLGLNVAQFDPSLTNNFVQNITSTQLNSMISKVLTTSITDNNDNGEYSIINANIPMTQYLCLTALDNKITTLNSQTGSMNVTSTFKNTGLTFNFNFYGFQSQISTDSLCDIFGNILSSNSNVVKPILTVSSNPYTALLMYDLPTTYEPAQQLFMNAFINYFKNQTKPITGSVGCWVNDTYLTVNYTITPSSTGITFNLAGSYRNTDDNTIPTTSNFTLTYQELTQDLTNINWSESPNYSSNWLNAGALNYVLYTFVNNSKNSYLINSTDGYNVINTSVGGFKTADDVVNAYYQATKGLINLKQEFYPSSANFLVNYNDANFTTNAKAMWQTLLKANNLPTSTAMPSWFNNNAVWTKNWSTAQQYNTDAYNSYLESTLQAMGTPNTKLSSLSGENVVELNGVLFAPSNVNAQITTATGYYIDAATNTWKDPVVNAQISYNNTVINNSHNNFSLTNWAKNLTLTNPYLSTPTNGSLTFNEGENITSLLNLQNQTINFNNPAMFNYVSTLSGLPSSTFSTLSATKFANIINNTYQYVSQPSAPSTNLSNTDAMVYYALNTALTWDYFTKNVMFDTSLGGWLNMYIANGYNSVGSANYDPDFPAQYVMSVPNNPTSGFVPFTTYLTPSVYTSYNSNGFINGVNPTTGQVAVSFVLSNWDSSASWSSPQNPSSNGTVALTPIGSSQPFFIVSGLKKETITINTADIFANNTASSKLVDWTPDEAVLSANINTTINEIIALLQASNQNNPLNPWINWSKLSITPKDVSVLSEEDGTLQVKGAVYNNTTLPTFTISGLKCVQTINAKINQALTNPIMITMLGNYTPYSCLLEQNTDAFQQIIRQRLLAINPYLNNIQDIRIDQMPTNDTLQITFSQNILGQVCTYIATLSGFTSQKEAFDKITNSILINLKDGVNINGCITVNGQQQSLWIGNYFGSNANTYNTNYITLNSSIIANRSTALNYINSQVQNQALQGITNFYGYQYQMQNTNWINIAGTYGNNNYHDMQYLSVSGGQIQLNYGMINGSNDNSLTTTLYNQTLKQNIMSFTKITKDNVDSFVPNSKFVDFSTLKQALIGTYAQTGIAPDVPYSIDNNNYTILNFTTDMPNITIPDNFNNTAVSCVNGFSNLGTPNIQRQNTNLANNTALNVSFGSGIKVIGENAFSTFNNPLTLNNNLSNVQVVCENAFNQTVINNNVNLTNAIYIGNNAFNGSFTNTTLSTLGQNIGYIGSFAFNNDEIGFNTISANTLYLAPQSLASLNPNLKINCANLYVVHNENSKTFNDVWNGSDLWFKKWSTLTLQQQQEAVFWLIATPNQYAHEKQWYWANWWYYAVVNIANKEVGDWRNTNCNIDMIVNNTTFACSSIQGKYYRTAPTKEYANYNEFSINWNN